MGRVTCRNRGGIASNTPRIRAVACNMARLMASEALAFIGASRRLVTTLRADVAGQGLVPIPHLTPETFHKNKTGDVLLHNHTDQPSASAHIGDVGPTLVPHTFNNAKIAKDSGNRVVREFKGVIVNQDIHHPRGGRCRTND